jgi:hypothetical protein
VENKKRIVGVIAVIVLISMIIIVALFHKPKNTTEVIAPTYQPDQATPIQVYTYEEPTIDIPTQIPLMMSTQSDNFWEVIEVIRKGENVYATFRNVADQQSLLQATCIDPYRATPAIGTFYYFNARGQLAPIDTKKWQRFVRY